MPVSRQVEVERLEAHTVPRHQIQLLIKYSIDFRHCEIRDKRIVWQLATKPRKNLLCWLLCYIDHCGSLFKPFIERSGADYYVLTVPRRLTLGVLGDLLRRLIFSDARRQNS